MRTFGGGAAKVGAGGGTLGDCSRDFGIQRRRDKRYIERARVLRIAKDANVGGSRVRRGFVRDYSAGIIIFLEENRVR